MDEYISVIKLFANTYGARSDYMPCDGQELQIMQYQALYSLLGTRFGGNGQTTFRLPDLRGKEPIPEMKYYICVNGVYPVRD